mmetsp:Transcript_2705/g.3887  ORF Transcript_2705/g.3887 Transcript_2705/m.3887 type:complete len:246 (+) Transcript_2705:156-893(+)
MNVYVDPLSYQKAHVEELKDLIRNLSTIEDIEMEFSLSETFVEATMFVTRLGKTNYTKKIKVPTNISKTSQYRNLIQVNEKFICDAVMHYRHSISTKKPSPCKQLTEERIQRQRKPGYKKKAFQYHYLAKQKVTKKVIDKWTKQGTDIVEKLLQPCRSTKKEESRMEITYSPSKQKMMLHNYSPISVSPINIQKNMEDLRWITDIKQIMEGNGILLLPGTQNPSNQLRAALMNRDIRVHFENSFS